VARSSNHCYRGKAIDITDLSVYVSVRACVPIALLIQHVTRMRDAVKSCGPSVFTTFLDIMSYTARFSEKNVFEHKSVF
jgi:hypothetical protein